MKEEVTAITCGNDSVELHCKSGVLQAYHVPIDRLFYIHIKGEGCTDCRKHMEEQEDRTLFWVLMEKIGTKLSIVKIDIVNVPNSNTYAAVCDLSNGEQCTMVPSDAIALALTQGKLGVDFHVYVDEEEVKRQEAILKEKEAEKKEVVQFLDTIFRGNLEAA